MSIYFLGPIQNADNRGGMKVNLVDIIMRNTSSNGIDVLVEGVSSNRKIYQSLCNVPAGEKVSLQNIAVNHTSFTFQIATTSLSAEALNITVAGKKTSQEVVGYLTDQLKVIE